MRWEELIKLQQAAVRARVPQSIPGLQSRASTPNIEWWRRGTSYQRNGRLSVFTHINGLRTCIYFFFFMNIYHMIRVPLTGWTEMIEHHSYNMDNLVYDKLSSRQLPYAQQMDALWLTFLNLNNQIV